MTIRSATVIDKKNTCLVARPNPINFKVEKGLMVDEWHPFSNEEVKNDATKIQTSQIRAVNNIIRYGEKGEV